MGEGKEEVVNQAWAMCRLGAYLPFERINDGGSNTLESLPALGATTVIPITVSLHRRFEHPSLEYFSRFCTDQQIEHPVDTFRTVGEAISAAKRGNG